MQNILIIGADSTIGAHLKKHCDAHGKTVYGTTRHANRCTETTFFLDLLNPDAFHIPYHITIDTVVFCAAMSTIKECEENKEKSYQINVTSPITLATYLKNRFNPFMIFLSSNAVFNGSKPFCLETEPPCPINYYGQCKVETEKKLAKITNKLTILRMTKVLHPDHALIKKWIHDLKNGEKIYPFTDLMLAPISLDMVSTAIEKLSALKKSGIFHLSGKQDITYAELAKMIGKKINVNESLIIQTQDIEPNIKIYNSLATHNTQKILSLLSQHHENVFSDLF